MGNQCCKFSASSSKYRPDSSSPCLLSYQKSKSLQRNYLETVPEKLKQPIRLPNELVKEEPLKGLSQYRKPSINENYIIVWLTSNIDKNQNSINYLQSIFNSFRLFTDIDAFFAFIIQIKEQKLFLILSDTFVEKNIVFIHKMSPLIAIYIITKDKSQDEQWIKQYRKIEGIFTNIEPICKKLQHKIHLSENDIIPIEILNSSTIIIQYLIKQILLHETDYHEKCKRDFLNFARQQYPNELNIINEFEENYTPSKAIWWYTRKCFLYFAMNNAFRTQNIELLIKLGFFIRDLHHQIDRSYEAIDKPNKAIVYRGQGILQDELEIIKNNQNGLFSFKNFFGQILIKIFH